MCSGLRLLLECLDCQLVDTGLPVSDALVARRLRTLAAALVTGLAEPCSWWGLHWQDAASCLVLLGDLHNPPEGPGDHTAGVAAAVLLRLLPTLREGAGGRAKQCVLSCQELLAEEWCSETMLAHPQWLTAAQLVSWLEAVALCASGTMALLEAELAQHSQPARLEGTGMLF